MSISDKLRSLYFRGNILRLPIGYENAGIKFYGYEPRYIYPEICSVGCQYRIERSPSWSWNICTSRHAIATFCMPSVLTPCRKTTNRAVVILSNGFVF